MKLGLGVYQVIWYGQKSIVRGVKHVLKLIGILLAIIQQFVLTSNP
jgi:hypothetical protein